MELIERPDLRAVKYLSSITYETFRESCLKDARESGGKKPKERDMKTWYSLLKQFCKTNIKTKGITKRIYSYSQNTPAGLGGRLFGGGSIQGIWGVYRGLLMRGIGTDIDMSNCHPVLLKYICKKHNIICPNLDYYVNNRDVCLAEFPTRAIGKNAYLVSTNNDKPLKGSNLPAHLKAYDKEMKAIQKELVKLPEYQKLQETIPEYKLTLNYNGSVVNRILCYYENIVLNLCIHVLNKRGIEIAILMFDGLMVYGDYYQDTELLREIENYVEEQLPELNMKWAYKPHDDTLQIPEDFKEETVIFYDGVRSDKEGAMKVFELYPHWNFCGGVLYVFNDETGMWSDKQADIYKVLGKFENDLYLLKQVVNDGKTEYEKTNKSYGNNTHLMKELLPQLETLCVNDDWINQKSSSSLGKILFNNGYYDYKEQLFYDTFNPEILFFGKIHHDFSHFSDLDIEYMEDIKKRFFYDTLGKEVGDYFIETLSRGLAGDVQKRFLFALGGTNTGKSILTKGLQLSLGDYVGGFNAENMAYRTSSGDEAQANRWAMLLKNKRLILSNEIKSNCELNGNFIKKVSNGGSDMLIGRGHCGNEEAFTPHFLPICFANDLPKITPYDDAVDNRIRVLSYVKQFVDEPSNELELKKDDNIKAELETSRFQRCLVGIFILQYLNYTDDGAIVEPPEIKQAKSDWIGDEVIGGVIENLLGDYEITNNPDDYVPSCEIEAFLKDGKYGITMKKFGMEMKKYTTIKRYENVVSKSKKLKGKVVQCWVGIKTIDTNEDNECSI